MNNLKKGGKTKGFTLIELVVVVLILGILAAVAAPKMFDTASDARSNSAHHSLMVVRDAIELHRAQVGSLPAAATIKTDLAPFLRGPFPSCQVGNTNDNVRAAVTDPITASGTEGWAYNETTGDFVVNHADGIAW